jgi:hypothetical protein
MDFQRSVQHDDRRRRLLTEEPPGGGVPPRRGPRTTAGESSSRLYGERARMDRHARITDLVPRRFGVVALLVLLLAVWVGALEGLYAWMPRLAAMTTDGRIAAFDLDGEGSLGAWTSTLLLAAASGVAFLIYSLRRHRLDDYHGRYRAWLWAGACWLGMSMDEGASLHEGFKELMTYLTGSRLAGDGSLWWAGAYFLVLGIVGLRLLLEMRSCRLSTSVLVLAGACYAVAVAAQLEWLSPQSGARGIMLEEGLELAGHGCLLLSMLLHARYVLLEIEGKLAPKAGKKSAEGAPVRRSLFGRAKVDPPHVSPSPPAGRRSDLEPVTPRTAAIMRSAAGTPSPAGASSRPEKPAAGAPRADADESERRLSRAERKALRKQRQRERFGDDEDE